MEQSVTLYERGLLSFGKAAELAQLSRFQFADLITSRGIPRHYGAEELAEDLAYALAGVAPIANFADFPAAHESVLRRNK